MANEFYTLIVVPHAKARFRKFQVSVRLTKWVLGTGATLAFVLSGKMRFIMEGKSITLNPGETLCIPPNVPHSAEALEDTIDLDVFTPPRADWAAKDDAYLRR